jgi:hypothetical protein
MFFGDPLQPVVLLFIFPKLFWKNWPLGVAVAALPALLISSSLLFPRLWPNSLRPAVFVGCWMLISIVPVGLYADWKRREAIAAFNPDAELQHSFFRSLHNVPAEYQFYVHAAVLKNCVPYLWSYRAMRLEELISPGVAVNVLPKEWLDQCNIRRPQ